MPVALRNKIDLIPAIFFNELNDYIDYLIFKSGKQNSSEKYPEEFWSLFGAGKDLDLQIPEDVEFSADELHVEI